MREVIGQIAPHILKGVFGAVEGLPPPYPERRNEHQRTRKQENPPVPEGEDLRIIGVKTEPQLQTVAFAAHIHRGVGVVDSFSGAAAFKTAGFPAAFHVRIEEVSVLVDLLLGLSPEREHHVFRVCIIVCDPRQIHQLIAGQVEVDADIAFFQNLGL